MSDSSLPTPKVIPGWLIAVILILLLVLTASFLAQGIRVGTRNVAATPTTGARIDCKTYSQGPAPSAAEKQFDEHDNLVAFSLAQMVNAYRQGHPAIGLNMGMLCLELVLDDGTMIQDPSNIYEGFDDAQGLNTEHSEYKAFNLGLLGSMLPAWQNNRLWTQVVSLNVVIFSQVIVCRLCKKGDMPSWRAELQRQSGKPTTMSVWELVKFNPKLPKQTGAVSTPEDVQKANIAFA